MRKISTYSWIAIISFILIAVGCNSDPGKSVKENAELYTCPMDPEVKSNQPGQCLKCGMDLVRVELKRADSSSKPVVDSGSLYICPMDPEVKSNQPGQCPICGMDLELASQKNDSANKNRVMVPGTGYTCPMHPQIHSDTAGICPICGMKLEKEKSPLESRAVSLNTLLQPANQQVVASVPMVHMMDREENLEMETYGSITYDTRSVGTVVSNVAGRIEKLYVKYRYQQVNRGQKIMEIYSPELMTAQQNLLFLLKNDPENATMIHAAKQKLVLLGMSDGQLENVIKSGKVNYAVTVFSKYSGHVHEAGSDQGMLSIQPDVMKDVSLTTKELSLKEGMYIEKGQTIFSVFNSNRAWVVVNIFAGQAALVKPGDKVRVTPATDRKNGFPATISYIEPFYREGNKTVTARIYFDNSKMKIPIGTQVEATIFAGSRKASWLPEEAVLSLGLDKIVFVKTGEAFVARKIETGIINKHLIQVLGGLDKTEAVAANAQYLVDSESFIKTN